MKEIVVVSSSGDGMTVVVNVGSADEIEPGQRFLIFGEGEELHDPITKQSLGKLEIVRGTGKAVHVQERMTTVRSDIRSEPARTIRRRRNTSLIESLNGIFGPEEIEEVMPQDSLPFDAARVGDRGRLI